MFLVGAAGTAAELVLLEHMEDAWQWVPVVLLALGLVMGGVLVVHRRRLALMAFRVLASLFVIAGGLGVYQHYRGNAEFELEMYPSRHGVELFRESLKGATPALAPGALAQLGLVGLLFTFRHPALAGRNSNDIEPEGESR